MPAAIFGTPSRRDFLGQLATAGAVLAAGGCASTGSPVLAAPTASRMAPVTRSDPEKDRSWDHSWLNTLTARHKQVFDVGFLGEGQALRTIRNYLNAHRDIFGMSYPQVNAVAGIAGAAYPIDLDDATWAKYGFGEESKTKDPRTGTWATRNVFRLAETNETYADYTVEALQARGVIFWMCNNVLKKLTQRLAAKTQAPEEAVRADLIAGLLPGIYLVPAHTMALGLAQEHGCSYESIGA